MMNASLQHYITHIAADRRDSEFILFVFLCFLIHGSLGDVNVFQLLQ